MGAAAVEADEAADFSLPFELFFSLFSVPCCCAVVGSPLRAAVVAGLTSVPADLMGAAAAGEGGGGNGRPSGVFCAATAAAAAASCFLLTSHTLSVGAVVAPPVVGTPVVVVLLLTEAGFTPAGLASGDVDRELSAPCSADEAGVSMLVLAALRAESDRAGVDVVPVDVVVGSLRSGLSAGVGEAAALLLDGLDCAGEKGTNRGGAALGASPLLPLGLTAPGADEEEEAPPLPSLARLKRSAYES